MTHRILSILAALALVHLGLYAFGVPPLWAQPLTDGREALLVVGHVVLFGAWALSAVWGSE